MQIDIMKTRDNLCTELGPLVVRSYFISCVIIIGTNFSTKCFTWDMLRRGIFVYVTWMKHLDSHTIVKFMCEKIRTQRPELLVSKVSKVYQSVTMTQIGKFEFDGELVINGSCCISKGEGRGRMGIYSGFLLTVMDCELILGSPSLKFQRSSF